jgi:poly(3-hydroxybutyrate) depolymerase
VLRHRRSGELQVFTYRPEAWSGERLLFVMHGVLRNADEYRDHAVGMGDRFDALVVAPKFDSERFPSRAYQRGGLLREDGSPRRGRNGPTRACRSSRRLARVRTGKPDAKLYVIGHSAGGQFLVRMRAFADTGAERIVAANPAACCCRRATCRSATASAGCRRNSPTTNGCAPTWRHR